MTPRKKYSKEFKLDAIGLVLDQGYTRAEAAKSLDINPNLLTRWIKEQKNDDGQSFRGNGKLTPEQQEVRTLKAKVKRLEMAMIANNGWMSHNLVRMNDLQAAFEEGSVS